MQANPARKGLGSLLMWHAAVTALFREAATMDATGVALDAQDFYHKSGFLPDRGEMDEKARIVAEGRAAGDLSPQDEEHIWATPAATWHGDSRKVLERSHARISATWTRLQDVALVG
jgi:hypothetical protein